ncbi:hypothetical protein Tco_1278567 [Tanacetum coccineum]
MASTRAFIFKASKRLKINIILPKQLFVDLTHDDSKTPSPKHQFSSPSAPNVPSKTPLTKGTSSSFIDYTPKSPTSSTSPSTNSYLNSPTSPPPRVPPPPPTQENTSIDITLTLLLITLLDVQFNTPSPSPPIFGHLIPWNLLEAHGDSYIGTKLLKVYNCSNFGVTCKDKAKRRNSGAKTKTFKENYYLLLYAYSVLTDHLIRRIHQLDAAYLNFYSGQRIALQSKRRICSQNDSTYSVNSIRRTAIQQTHTAYSSQ